MEYYNLVETFRDNLYRNYTVFEKNFKMGKQDLDLNVTQRRSDCGLL